jgi:hypothetical protein
MCAVTEDIRPNNLSYTAIRTPGGQTCIPIYAVYCWAGIGFDRAADISKERSAGNGPGSRAESRDVGDRRIGRTFI